MLRPNQNALVEDIYNKEELVRDPSFRNWVQGRASREETRLWDRWVSKNPQNRRLARQVQEEITGIQLTPAGDISTDKAWNDIEKRIKKDHEAVLLNASTRKKDWTDWIVRVAAVFLLVFISGYLITHFYQIPPVETAEVIKKEVVTDYGERKQVKLSDGSVILLNGYSNMLYTIDRNDSNAVNIFLEGEAYFSVAKRQNAGDTPFKVRTSGGMVEVLGTRFVVATRKNNTQVVLEEGAVTVNPFQASSATVLEPGQLGEFSNRSDSVFTRNVNLEVYTSWVSGRLYFEKAPMEEVVNRLEKTFGIKMVIRDSSLYDNNVSGSIESSKIEIITSALSEMLNTSIQMSDSEKVIYAGGSLEK